jgi:hypothetical protein
METKNNNTAQTNDSDQEKRPIDIARENLKLLSLEVKDLVEDGTFFSINDAIMETLYKDDTHREFKSYRQWKKDGYQVKKGEKAYLLWAKPKQIQKPIEEGKSSEDLDEMVKYFPIAYLFSNAQVNNIEAEQEAEVTPPTETRPTRWQPLEY